MAKKRISYIDNTRAIASVLGIFFHAAFIFTKPWEINPQPPVLFEELDYLVTFLVPARMPLFLFVSGYFTAMALKKHSAAEFAANRSRRILLPFAFACLTILPLQHLVRNYYYGSEGPIAKTLEAMNPFSQAFSLSHLWFLYFICIFSALSLLEHTWYRKPRREAVAADYGRGAALGLLAALFILEQVMVAGGSLLEKKIPLAGSWLNFGAMASCFPVFYLGYLCRLRPSLLEHIHKVGMWLLFIGLVLLVPLKTYERHSTSWLMSTMSASLIKWTLTLGLLNLIARFLNFSNKFMQYMSAASYGVYILSHPIIIAVAAVLLPMGLVSSPLANFCLILTISTALTYLFYHLLVFKSRLGALLLTGQQLAVQTGTEAAVAAESGKTS